ncbi:TrkH family potassium uptake protein [Mycoplasma miroungirhinis]|uniref:TrkH family potassium uptake protein n=1 Tax=Mycoplasma miroungirhinis TaxID=754516 RepID=A0A6M4JDH0_9MOLU|nr:TrkH family potassium uptake protein [Mycoplasma miroungirhinis]QJR44119.1 TrkH family potassium uptake protein [Mycoplasma miroungirhinis]
MKNTRHRLKKWNINGKNIFYYLKQTGKIKYIFLVYLIITIILSLFLYWPISHKNMLVEKPDFNYGDALFIAASAFSDTGLSNINISEGFNEFGQSVIAIGILIGGFGFFTLKLYILRMLFGWMFKTKTSHFKRDLIQVERGSTVVGDTQNIIKVSLTTLFILLFTSIIFMTFYFYFSNEGFFSDQKALINNDIEHFNPYLKQKYNPHNNILLSLRYATFESISAINNAGFDIIGPNSINAYNSSYVLQIWIIILILAGGMGYPTIYDFYKKIQAKIKKQRYEFTLFTKLNLTTYFLVTTIGILFTFLFEVINKNPNGFWHQNEYGNSFNKSFAIIFNTLSTRSAGFSTVDYYHFSNQTILLHAVLMFIGFAPVSTAGGIRNITVAIIFLSIFNTIRGRNTINSFNRQIGKETLIKAINILTIGLILILIGTFIVSFNLSDLTPANLSKNEKQYTIVSAFFEVCSAFGSSGLSTGITEKLNLTSKLFLIIYMFIGQLGITSTILVWGNQKSYVTKYRYIYEDVSLG